jgi:hypothetical protein
MEYTNSWKLLRRSNMLLEIFAILMLSAGIMFTVRYYIPGIKYLIKSTKNEEFLNIKWNKVIIQSGLHFIVQSLLFFITIPLMLFFHDVYYSNLLDRFVEDYIEDIE